METVFYHSITPITRKGASDLNELRVSVRYDKSANIAKRGLYVHFKPVHRQGGIESCTILSCNAKEDGFKMFVRQLGRASEKQTADVCNRIEPIVGEIAKKYDAEDWKGIVALVKNAM